jgi:hypothetical protein
MTNIRGDLTRTDASDHGSQPSVPNDAKGPLAGRFEQLVASRVNVKRRAQRLRQCLRLPGSIGRLFWHTRHFCGFFLFFFKPELYRAQSGVKKKISRVFTQNSQSDQKTCRKAQAR